MLTRIRSRGFAWLEWLIAVLILGLGILEVFDCVPGQGWPGPRLVGVAVVLVTVAGLAAMRARPVPALLLATLPFAAYMVIWRQPSSSAAVFMIILVGFGWGRYRGPHQYAVAAAVAAFDLSGGLRGDEPGLPDLAFVVGITAAGFAAGRLVSNRQRLADQLRAQQPLIAQAAVTDERARIARELHDVVAHGVSVMVIQSVAARASLRRDPTQAEEAMRVVESSGKEALAELRRLLGVLRADDGSANGGPGLQPQPGLGDLDRLVAGVAESGLRVDLEVSGGAQRLTPGVDLTAYRIIQEALTNVIRHAGTDSAVVRVAHGRGSLELEILDDGTGKPSATATNGAGHGLIGMRERAALYGGEVKAGARPGGGYAVRAHLPIEPVSGT